MPARPYGSAARASTRTGYPRRHSPRPAGTPRKSPRRTLTGGTAPGFGTTRRVPTPSRVLAPGTSCRSPAVRRGSPAPCPPAARRCPPENRPRPAVSLPLRSSPVRWLQEELVARNPLGQNQLASDPLASSASRGTWPYQGDRRQSMVRDGLEACRWRRLLAGRDLPPVASAGSAAATSRRGPDCRRHRWGGSFGDGRWPAPWTRPRLQICLSCGDCCGLSARYSESTVHPHPSTGTGYARSDERTRRHPCS